MIGVTIPQLFTVTQVDWYQGEYCTTIHTSALQAQHVMQMILEDRLSQNPIVESDDISDYISGEGWEARLEVHTGEEEDGDIHGYSILTD